MQVLSKIFAENLDDKSHQLTDNRALFLGSSAFSLLTWTSSLILYSRLSNRDERCDEISSAYLQSKKQQPKPASFSKMLKQLMRILKQVLTMKDAFYAASIAASLILRTMCDLWMIQNLTQVEAAIIGGDFKKLKLNILEFLYASPILTLLNNGLKFCISRLQMNLRFKISSHLTERYTRNLNFYHLNAMNVLPNVDQLLTNDIDRFSNTLVDVYSNIAKPFFDVVVYLQRLSVTYTGMRTPAAMLSYLMVAGTVLTGIRRPMAKMTMQESQLEGEHRFVHSRLITNCEEIAFLQGNQREQVTLVSSLNRLRNHVSRMLIFKFNIDCLDNMITKYLAQVCGYMALSIPFMGDRYARDHHTSRLETYYKSGRIMLNMSQSIGRLVTAGRDINKLAAYTQRVSELFDEIEKDNPISDRMRTITSRSGNSLVPFSGRLRYCDAQSPFIQLHNVPLVTPNGEILIESLSFKINSGQNLLITGPNGSGKSSLFRLLAELWPLYGGKMVKPRNDKIFYVSQKPYMALGTFRDQLIYPQTHQDMVESGKTDADLLEILRVVELDYLLERESLNSVADWQDILSGGEKQRVALARVLYHRPLFAILDECTSAVSADFEQTIYQYFSETKFCTLLSVTHRVKQLERFHHFKLDFDGLGSFSYRKI